MGYLFSTADRLGCRYPSETRYAKNEAMSHQARKNPVESKIRKQAETPVATEVIAPAPQEQTGDQSAVLDVLQRMETLLGERIDRTREKLRSTEEAVSNLRERERRADALEAEVRELRKSAKALEIRASQLDAENAGLRNSLASMRETVAKLETAKQATEIRMSKLDSENADLGKSLAYMRETVRELETAKQTAENNAALLQTIVQQVKQVAAIEVGRAVKALLSSKKSGLWRKETPVSVYAKLLVDSRIVDPGWYLLHHDDVAKAGMEPALHYILHGAEEGRIPGPALDEATRKVELSPTLVECETEDVTPMSADGDS